MKEQIFVTIVFVLFFSQFVNSSSSAQTSLQTEINTVRALCSQYTYNEEVCNDKNMTVGRVSAKCEFVNSECKANSEDIAKYEAISKSNMGFQNFYYNILMYLPLLVIFLWILVLLKAKNSFVKMVYGAKLLLALVLVGLSLYKFYQFSFVGILLILILFGLNVPVILRGYNEEKKLKALIVFLILLELFVLLFSVTTMYA